MSNHTQSKILKQAKLEQSTLLPNIGRSFEDLLPLASFVSMMIEFGALVLAGYVSDAAYHQIIYNEAPSDLWLVNGVTTATIFVLLQASSGKYATSWILSRTLRQSHLLRDWLITFSVILSFSFLSKYTSDQSRGAYVVFGIFGLVTVFLWRKIISAIFAKAVKSAHFFTRNIVLIGTRNEIENYYAQEELWKKGIRVSASVIIDPENMHGPVDLWISRNQLQVRLESTDKITSHLRQIQADDIILTIPWSQTKAIETILDKTNQLPCAIYLAPDPAMSHLKSNMAGPSDLSEALTDPQTGLSGIRIARRPLTPVARLAKRSFDILASSMGLILLSPILLLIAILIRLESPGSPLFRQKRNGFNERPFHIYKFRSMVSQANSKFSQTQRGDTRVTKLGAFLRRTNLDELPQLLNVLFGTMSLVGPRPHAIAHNDEFMTEIAHYANRHHVKPGITGWAQINGWRGAAFKQKQMKGRVDHDLEYIKNWSFGLDIKILFYTFFSKKAFRNAF